jgi:K+:H+ antiporter
MPHELPLLINIAVALSYALVGGLLARRAGLPPIAGYLLAGVAMGPFTPGFVGDPHAIGQLAELGVIFLMFGVGLHFSFKDLWQVRDIAIPGAVIQMLLATALGFGLTRSWGWTPTAGLLLGVAVSVASTVVLLRGLMDHGLMETPHGRVAVGWLVFEDIATVLILVLLPVVAGTSGHTGWRTAGTAFGKAALFIGLMLVIGNRAVPWLLQRVVRTRSRELFILVALTVALGTALLSATAFGVSLALGAFVAGVVVSESPYSHQVGADLLPFREAFAVLFFVSVGMLVNPGYLAAHWMEVLELSTLVVVGKALIASCAGFLFPHPARTALVVAAGLSQIGEFSFIVGQAGMALGVLDQAQYSLILAGALVSITVNPLMFRLIAPAERWLRARPAIWRWIDRHGPAAAGDLDALRDHVVIVGWGRVGRHIADLLGRLDVPRLVVETNPGVADRLRAAGVDTLFGDAANSEILQHAGLTRARALVVTVADQATTQIIVAAAHQLAPALHIIARAATRDGAKALSAAGANEIVLPELEAGVQVVRRTLLMLGFPIRQVQDYAESIRRDEIPEETTGNAGFTMLDQLVHATHDLELGWATVAPDSVIRGLTLSDANLRSRCGVSVVAIAQHGEVTTNPGPEITLRTGDRVALIGTPAQIAAGEQLIQGPVL